MVVVRTHARRRISECDSCRGKGVPLVCRIDRSMARCSRNKEGREIFDRWHWHELASYVSVRVRDALTFRVFLLLSHSTYVASEASHRSGFLWATKGFSSCVKKCRCQIRPIGMTTDTNFCHPCRASKPACYSTYNLCKHI